VFVPKVSRLGGVAGIRYPRDRIGVFAWRVSFFCRVRRGGRNSGCDSLRMGVSPISTAFLNRGLPSWQYPAIRLGLGALDPTVGSRMVPVLHCNNGNPLYGW